MYLFMYIYIYIIYMYIYIYAYVYAYRWLRLPASNALNEGCRRGCVGHYFNPAALVVLARAGHTLSLFAPLSLRTAVRSWTHPPPQRRVFAYGFNKKRPQGEANQPGEDFNTNLTNIQTNTKNTKYELWN